MHDVCIKWEVTLELAGELYQALFDSQVLLFVGVCMALRMCVCMYTMFVHVNGCLYVHIRSAHAHMHVHTHSLTGRCQ